MTLVKLTSPDDEIQRKLALEKARLEKELGLESRPARHFHRPEERPFTAAQRNHTTVLFGGLTWKHERLIQGTLEGLGYRCEPLPDPDLHAFQLGKEYGNNGQCNPTYFTVGSLLQHLQRLEEQGMSKQEIVDRYIFFGAGACGPCRFGMYEAEYRLALRNSGFEGFRVILFQQSGGLDQSQAEAGLNMNLDFFLGILNALNVADLANSLGHAVRPYERNPGQTDRVMEESIECLRTFFLKKRRFEPAPRLARLLRGKAGAASYTGKFLDQLFSDYYVQGMRDVRRRFDEIEVDYTRVRPVVKITGEFWAQTTEGDGNYRMFRFLEEEGAEVAIEPVGTWILYMLHQGVQKTRDRRAIRIQAPWWRLDRQAAKEWSICKTIVQLKLAERLFQREYNRLRAALDNAVHPLNDQYELQRLGHPYYNSRSGGGEGHLEIAKNIYYSHRGLAHMVLSLKPFGCMPSTQSDGAQAAVTSHYRDMIYLPVETSGEGAVNAYSRVQMALGEARAKAAEEFKQALAAAGAALPEIRSFVNAHPELSRSSFTVPRRPGIVGKAANFVLHVGELMRQERTSTFSESLRGGHADARSVG
jgi:predicted nucleotide-binding protein (sugar kinase/HSP70/actin superfamily)